MRHYNYLDINECQTKNGDCDQQCINLEGSFKCVCYNGDEQEKNGKCKLVNLFKKDGSKNTVSVIVANKENIEQINLERYGIIIFRLFYICELLRHSSLHHLCSFCL